MRLAVVLRAFVVGLVAFGGLLPSQAVAWGGTGHRVICRIAWQETTADGRAFVKELLSVADDNGFARLCLWADDVRQSEGYGWTKTHHYVNVARARPLDPRGDCPPDGCLLRAIAQQGRFFNESSGPKTGRAEALKFIAHYIGDLHQPLHVGYGDDAGGNGIAVRFCPRNCWRSIDNLHQVWDSAILEAGSPSKDHALATELAHDITAAERASWKKGDVVQWGRETYAVATDKAYRPVDGSSPAAGYLGDSRQPAHLGPDYTKVMRPTALEQLQKAGVRLGVVLDAMAHGRVPESLLILPSLAVTPAKNVASHVVVRSAADTRAAVIAELPAGESAELLGRERRWYRIRLADRRQGYVRTNKVRIR
jgi:hypothetical protein